MRVNGIVHYFHHCDAAAVAVHHYDIALPVDDDASPDSPDSCQWDALGWEMTALSWEMTILTLLPTVDLLDEWDVAAAAAVDVCHYFSPCLHL